MLKSFLYSTAVVIVPTVAMAADMPSKTAAPVDYVRVCKLGDVTGFVIPGSDTCLKVSGRIRAEYLSTESFGRDANSSATRARGYVALDALTNSDYGLVRASTRTFVTRETGRVLSGSVVPGGTRLPSGTDANVTLDYAYVQFGNLTAGRVPTSFFEFAPFGGVSYDGGGLLGRGADYGSINVVAYTATFGSVSASIAIEDAIERRAGLGAVLGDAPTSGGHAAPDLVGRLDYSAEWGQAALTAAIHQSRTGSPGTPLLTQSFVVGNVLAVNKSYPNTFTAGAAGETAYGIAVQGGMKVNLPMVSAGDAVFVQAAYATGANSYTGWGSAGAGTLSPPTFDAAYDAAGKAKLSDSWSVTAGVLHYWTPTLRQGIFGAWGKLDQFGPSNDVAALSAGTNLIWSPVKNVDIGAEVVYAKLTQTPRSALPVQAFDHRDNWSGRLRFERDF